MSRQLPNDERRVGEVEVRLSNLTEVLSPVGSRNYLFWLQRVVCLWTVICTLGHGVPGPRTGGACWSGWISLRS